MLTPLTYRYHIGFFFLFPPPYVNMIASRSFKAVLICHLIVHATQAPLPGKLRYPPKQFKTGQTSSDLFGQRRMFAESHCTLR